MSNKSSTYSNDVIVKSFDETSDSLRTTLVNADVSINVDAFTDSIKIGDGSGSTTTITTVGAKKALDVNVTDITLDAANDSIAVKNGSNTLGVNPDGSINVKIGFSSATTQVITVTTASTTLLSTNVSRKYAHIINNGANAVWLQYGSAAVLGRGIQLNVGAIFTMSGHELFYGQINAISTTSTQIDILEGT